MFDTLTEQILKHIDRLGYRVGILADQNGHQLAATDRETGERFVVKGDDVYAAACELATMVGIEIEE